LKDYLEVEYSLVNRPITDYPGKLAKFIVGKFGLTRGQTILEVGCGRCELLQHFGTLGLDIHGIDNAESARGYAKNANAKFELTEFRPHEMVEIFEGKKFDIIFSKSFIEHISDPKAYLEWCFSILQEGGKVITLTPDWEANFKVFFDDYTHIKPFTVISLNQCLETAGFSNISVFKFRQLPSTWDSKTMNFLAAMSAFFSSPRSKKKWFRWSRELMIASVGTKVVGVK
jgi:2-polyprenyl-3-methyl-5-hydroxy-6-metoxy-1,4-benzoquinol methylase